MENKSLRHATLKLDFHYDAGHGWLQVPLKLVKLMEELKHCNISSYSYKDSIFAYLEEDCDASAFLKALEQYNLLYEVTEIDNGNTSSIRAKQQYK